MKIAVFYRDAFATGGVPGEIALLVNEMSKAHTVHYWGRNGNPGHTLAQEVTCHGYKHFFDLYKRFHGWLKQEKPDFILLVGFFMLENHLVAAEAKKLRIPVILNPLAQIVDEIFKGKIFTKDPDVRKLETSNNSSSTVLDDLLVSLNPFLKKLYLKLLGPYLVNKSKAIATFSTYESSRFLSFFPKYDGPLLDLKWGIDRVNAEADERHFFRDVLGFNDNKANYVYWGRLDWHYKGIDRLLNGVQYAVSNHPDVPFRLFLIGPDYHQGAEKVASFIAKHGLQDVVHLMLPGSYPAGSKTPLRDATASVYLSRWDGFPRTLREASFLNVPIMISPETHFSEVVETFQNGILVGNPNNHEEVGNALILLSDPGMQGSCRSSCLPNISKLSWSEIVTGFMSTVDKRIFSSNNH